MTTLTDRYVDAALRSIPEDQRADIELELRASIDDAVEARIAGGEDQAVAEDAVLVDLGDPDHLAARYTGRPFALIGPARYGEWRRLLRTLLLVVPVAGLGVGIAGSIAGGDIVDVLWQMAAVMFNVAVQICFWTTLVFAVMDRTGSGERVRRPWRTDDLPEPSAGPQVTLGDTVLSVVVAVIAIAAMFWQRGSELVTVDGEGVPVLDPDHWSTWWPFLIVVLVADAVLALVAYHRGRWTANLAAASVVLDLLFAVPVIWLLATDRFFVPAFLAGLDWEGPDPSSVLTTTVGVTVVVVTVWSIGEVVWKAGIGRRRAVAV
jgi:hypothetical protein